MSAPRKYAPAIPATMRAMVLDRFGGEFQLEERPVPEPATGEALVEVFAVGAGMTNELARDGVLGGSVPRIHGHELSGRVAALGPNTAGLEVGTMVTSSFYLLCGRCEWCESGRESLCSSFGGFVGIEVDGAFADFTTLPVANLVPIPAGVALRDAGIVADAVATPYHVMASRLKAPVGSQVAVIGAGGGLGTHAVQVARAFGCGVIGAERDPAKAAELERLGLVDSLVVPDGGDWGRDLSEAAGGALAGVIDTVGNGETLQQGYAALGRAGTLVVLGHVPGASLELDPERQLLEELAVVGTRYASRAEIRRSLELVRAGRVVPVVGSRAPLEELESALREARDERVFGRIVIDVADPSTYPEIA